MPPKMAVGLIYMIPKGGTKSMEIEKWRPITLLNTLYKIYAKVLSLRIQNFLPALIHPSQTGFIKERYILDKIFVFWEAVALAKNTKQDLTVFFLDFEKAYERVDCTFLEEIMIHMGFSEKWIKAVSALCNNPSSKVILAGGIGRPFKLSRSVRQGCPMAPYLFLLYAEALSSYISTTSSEIQGLCMPNSSEELVDCEFADDTTLYVQEQLENLYRIQKVLEKFCLGSGARLNWNKTVEFLHELGVGFSR